MSDAKRLRQVQGTFRARSPSYDEESPWMRDATLLAHFAPDPPHAGMALDLCGGTGLVTEALLRRGWNVANVDTSAEMLARSPGHPVLASAEKLPFRSRAFQLVCCRQGLQYLHLETMAQELARIAAPELRLGQIVLGNPDDLPWWLDYFDIASPGRRHVFTREDLGRLVSRSGYRLAEERHVVLRDRFDRSVGHLPKDEWERVMQLIERMPSAIATRLRLDGTSYQQVWVLMTAIRSA